MHNTPDILHKTPIHLDGAGSYEAPAGKHMPWHQHTVWEVVYYRAGHISCPIGTEVYTGQPGLILSTPPHIAHAEQALTAYKNYYLAIDAPADHPWPRQCFDDASRSIGNVCEMLVREWSSNRVEREHMLALLVQQLDLLLRRARAADPLSQPEQIVREAEQFMADHFARSLTIQEVARELSISPSALRAYFTRLRNYSPLEYVQAIRARHASEMLRTSTLTLEAIAHLCGYDSASHLSRHIKRAFGQSPGALRQKAEIPLHDIER